MRLLIDGYNLLHATDLFGAGAAAGTLHGSREALLGFLASRLDEKERRATTIVFDAVDAPPGAPDRLNREGIDVRFARGYPDADALLEEILHATRGARQLTVVSSDHRVQRAARSRGAKPIDSAPWFHALRQRAREGRVAAKPIGPVTDNAEWVREFSNPEDIARIERDALAAPPPRPAMPHPAPRPNPTPAAPASPATSQPGKPNPSNPQDRQDASRAEDAGAGDEKDAFGHGVFDPFPPGYGDDLLNE